MSTVRPSTAQARLGGEGAKKPASSKPKLGVGPPQTTPPFKGAIPKSSSAGRDHTSRFLREQGVNDANSASSPSNARPGTASASHRAASPSARTLSPSGRLQSPRGTASPRVLPSSLATPSSASSRTKLGRQRIQTPPASGLPSQSASSPATPTTPARRNVRLIPAKEAKDRVLVAVRKRPPKEGEMDIVDVVSATDVQVAEPRQKVDLTKYTETHQFQFDAAFGSEVSNASVFRRTVLPLVDFVLQGGMGSVFAFGQTGSGKTFTMLGANDGSEQTVYDLLANRNKLIPREDSKKKVHVKGLLRVETETKDDILRLVNQGSALRCTSVTGMNETSSRSHAVIQLALEQRGGPSGLLSFIDLAGSEKGSDTGENEKKTRLEGAEINKSLLALKECIRAMNDPSSGFTPFRGSKLTLILRESFIGAGRTVMIANISPHAASCVETVNTLRYADRVKQIGSAPGRGAGAGGGAPVAVPSAGLAEGGGGGGGGGAAGVGEGEGGQDGCF